MTPEQRRGYFRRWAAACQVQGWDAKNDALRRDATVEAIGVESTRKLTRPQITALFNWLDWMADPTNLDKAYVVANPDAAEEAEQRRRFLWVIGQQAFEDAYVARCAEGFVREEGKAKWQDLSAASLEKLSFTLKTRARQRDADAGERDPFYRRETPFHQRPAVKAAKRAAREPQVVPRFPAADAVPDDRLPF